VVATAVTADLAVIGGGVLGCFTAHVAARSNPEWRVVLLERRWVAAGATGWSAGVSFPLAATPEHGDLVRESAAGYAELDEAFARRCIRPVPMVYVVRRDHEPAFRLRVVGAKLRPLMPQESARVARMLPDMRLAADEVLLTHDGHGFVIDAPALANALVSAGGRAVDVRPGVTVEAVHREGDGYRVLTDTTALRARRVVVACGPWTPPAGHPVPLPDAPAARRKRVAALHVAVPTGPGDPLVYFVEDDLFILPLTDGAALASFYRDEWDTDPDSLDGHSNTDDLRSGADVLGRRSAAAAGAVTGGRAFCDLYTERRLPVVLRDPALPALATIRGGSGSGVRLAPALAARALRAVDARTPSTVSSREHA
jgi:glycine/D-amino acid oxidase-like deaminating enzyme